MKKNILVTGGSQGIGLEFVRQYLSRGHRVFACSRNADKSVELQQLKVHYGDRLEIFQLDVVDEESRCRLYEALSIRIEKFEILINNAGVIAGNETHSYPFGNLKQEDICRTLLVNSVAPLMMTEKVFPLLEKGTNPVVINITSDNGSIALRNNGGKYEYCASKAALNMITKILSIDLVENGIIVVALHPGWVKTPMTKDENAPLEPAESIGGMIKVIDALTMEDTGRFLDWKGNELPW